MRSLLIIFISFISIYIYGDIVTVPNYNYSVYPLEGWDLQEYSSDSSLSWISRDNGVFFSVDSWHGDEFTDINSMFTTLTRDLNAQGSCVKFQYLDRESAIGEIVVTLNGFKYKGWIVLINGTGHDYYISGFSLLENYRELYSEIQSGIDSFSIGKEGALSPGPITTFLDQTPNKKLVKYNIDFFDHIIPLEIMDNQFSSAQTVIEREANIMLNYSNDPDNFYNAWKRYYKILFRDNYTRLDPVYRALEPYLGRDKYSDYDLTELLMFWIQGYTYSRDLDTASDLLNPLEASVFRKGDCDSRSLILGILLHKFEIKSILMTSEKVKHAMTGVNIPGEGAKIEHKGNEYLTVELTAKALIGEIKNTMSDPELWTIINMEYESGF